MSNFKLKPYIDRLHAGEDLDELCDEIRRLPLSTSERSMYVDRLCRAAQEHAEAQNATRTVWQNRISSLIIGGTLLGMGVGLHFMLEARGFIGTLPFALGFIGLSVIASAFRRSD